MYFTLITALGLVPGLLAAGTVNCDFSTAANAGDTCDSFRGTWGLSVDTFKSLNPGVDCKNFDDTKEYCVVGSMRPDEPSTTTPHASITTTSTTTAKGPAATTSNAAPSPTQDGLISTCKAFYFAKRGDTCDAIAAAYGTFTTVDFVRWNPAVGKDCLSLWADTYYCVGVPGTPTTKPASTKKPVETCNPSAPVPTQSGAVCGCSKWHVVAKTTTCDSIYNYYKLSLADFHKWNPSVGTDCKALWVGYNVCIKGPNATPACNPSAPSPIQANVVCGCQKWHRVAKTTTCSSIYNYYKINAADFAKWNPSVGKDCKALWVDYNVCVKAPNATPVCNPSAPSPTQAGVTCGCKKWHLVAKTTTCSSIYNYYKITAANFAKWNPAVGKDCKALWFNYNVCVQK